MLVIFFQIYVFYSGEHIYCVLKTWVKQLVFHCFNLNFKELLSTYRTKCTFVD